MPRSFQLTFFQLKMFFLKREWINFSQNINSSLGRALACWWVMQTLAATGVLCRTMITVFHSVPGPAPATFSRPHSLIKKKSVFIIVRRLEVILGTVLRVLILRSLPDIETQSLKYWVKIFPRMIFLCQQQTLAGCCFPLTTRGRQTHATGPFHSGWQ